MNKINRELNNDLNNERKRLKRVTFEGKIKRTCFKRMTIMLLASILFIIVISLTNYKLWIIMIIICDIFLIVYSLCVYYMYNGHGVDW